MKIGKVVSIKSFNFKFLLKLDREKLILYFLSALGLLLGIVLFSKEGATGRFAEAVFSKIIAFKLQKDLIRSFLVSILCFTAPALLIVVLGSSIFGVVVIPALILIINGTFGLILAFSYSSFQISGLAFNSVLLIPNYFFFLISIIISAASVMKYSIFQLNCLSKRSSQRAVNEFSCMVRKQGIVALILILNSIIEVVLDKVFIKSFNFF